jgi:hypothetical protein
VAQRRPLIAGRGRLDLLHLPEELLIRRRLPFLGGLEAEHLVGREV